MFIFTKLNSSESAAGVGGRINYAHWEEKTCLAYGLALEGWPPGVAKNPKEVKQPVLLRIQQDLLDGKTFYRKLSADEYDALSEKLTQQKLQQGSTDISTPDVSDGSQ